MADTITIRTSTERDVVKIVERGPQGPAGGGGGGGSGTVTSVALAGTGLSITGSPVTTSGTITANVTYGTTAGTACQGNDSRLSDARTPTAHTHVVADVTDLSLNKVPEARQTYNITSTNSGSPTQVDAQSAFQNLSGSIDCVVVLNNTTGIVYANIVVPDLFNAPGSQRGRVIIEATTSGSGDITNFRIDAEGAIVYPIAGYEEILPSKRLVFVWTGNNWNLECLHTASTPVQIYLPNAAGTLALTSDITKSAVGLGNVTNNAQTQAAIVPNTAPSAGQLLVGNAGGTAYAPATLSGDATIASTGALTLANTSTARTNIGLGNVPNVDTTNAANISSGVLPNARVNWAAPDAIGNTTASSVAATTLSASSTVSGTGFSNYLASPPAIGGTSAAAGTFTTLTGSTQIVGPQGATVGTTTDCAISVGAANTGFRISSNQIVCQKQGSSVWYANNSTGFVVAAAMNNGLIIEATDAPINFGRNVTLRSDAATGVLGQRDGTTAQEFRVYGTYTSSTNYQRLTVKTKAVTLSALSGASVATTGGFIPDGAVLVGLTTRVSTAITGATGYDIGDGTDADRWGANIGVALNTSSDNTNWTATTIQCFTAAQEVTLTAVGSNFTAGAVQIVAHYLAGEAD